LFSNKIDSILLLKNIPHAKVSKSPIPKCSDPVSAGRCELSLGLPHQVP
jgi:hypothetical protein